MVDIQGQKVGLCAYQRTEKKNEVTDNEKCKNIYIEVYVITKRVKNIKIIC